MPEDSILGNSRHHQYPPLEQSPPCKPWQESPVQRDRPTEEQVRNAMERLNRLADKHDAAPVARTPEPPLLEKSAVLCKELLDLSGRLNRIGDMLAGPRPSTESRVPVGEGVVGNLMTATAMLEQISELVRRIEYVVGAK